MWDQDSFPEWLTFFTESEKKRLYRFSGLWSFTWHFNARLVGRVAHIGKSSHMGLIYRMEVSVKMSIKGPECFHGTNWNYSPWRLDGHRKPYGRLRNSKQSLPRIDSFSFSPQPVAHSQWVLIWFPTTSKWFSSFEMWSCASIL